MHNDTETEDELNLGFEVTKTTKDLPKNEQDFDEYLNKLHDPVEKVDVNAQDSKFFRTALHYAVLKNLEDVIQVLLEHGAKVDLKDAYGKTALHYAAQEGHRNVIELLLKHNSEILHVLDREGRTPLHCVVYQDKEELVEEFLKWDVTLDIQNKEGLTPLYAAVMFGSWNVVKRLIKAGANLDIWGSRFDRILPISSEISQNTEKLVEILKTTREEFRDENWFKFDLCNNVVESDCQLKPSEVDGNQIKYLIAKNNKYPEVKVNNGKVGKWMLFPSVDRADEIWDKMKNGVKDGYLWKAKFALRDSYNPHLKKNPHFKTYPHFLQPYGAVLIYTKDYEDLTDVIDVLEYIENSGMKHPNEVIRYKINKQTNEYVYSTNHVKASIYRSDTVRHEILKNNTSSENVVSAASCSRDDNDPK